LFPSPRDAESPSSPFLCSRLVKCKSHVSLILNILDLKRHLMILGAKHTYWAILLSKRPPVRPVGEMKKRKKQKNERNLLWQTGYSSSRPRRHRTEIIFFTREDFGKMILTFKLRAKSVRCFRDVRMEIAFPRYFDWSLIQQLYSQQLVLRYKL